MTTSSATPRRPPQLKDVAALAGVSVPTVSRVLSGALPVSEPKRASVLAAIEELDYVPNPSARALATGTRNTVAVLTSETTLYGYATTLEGIGDGARAAGLGVLIGVIGSGSEGAKGAVTAVLGHSIAGIILLEFDEGGRTALGYIPRHLPVICVGSTSPVDPSVPHAGIDDHLGAEMATRHLIELGHRRIHYVGPVGGDPGSRRFTGWCAALDEAGLTERAYSQASWDITSGYECGLRLAEDPDLTAVVCGNDDLAFAVMRALHDRGRRVPDDVSIIGFDDTPVSRFTTPSLTTVAQDFRDLGQRAFTLMQRRLDGDTSVVGAGPEPVLMVRESTGPVRAGAGPVS